MQRQLFFLQTRHGNWESEVLIQEPVLRYFQLSSSLPIIVSSPKLSVRQGNFRRLTSTFWKWNNDSLSSFVFFFFGLPAAPSGRLIAALNASRHHHSCPGLSGSHRLTGIISEKARGQSRAFSLSSLLGFPSRWGRIFPWKETQLLVAMCLHSNYHAFK